MKSEETGSNRQIQNSRAKLIIGGGTQANIEIVTQQAEGVAATLLNNAAPALLKASKSAATARQALRYDEGINDLSKAIADHFGSVNTALVELDVYRRLLEQRSNLLMFTGRYAEAIADVVKARGMVTLAELDEADRLNKSIWALVGMEMVAIDDFAPARQHLDARSKEHGKPTVLAWGVLLSLAPDLPSARSLLDELTARGIKLNEAVWNILLGFVDECAQVWTWVKEMSRQGVKPGVVTWSILMDRTPNMHAARKVIKAMRLRNRLPNVVTWTTLLGRAADYTECLSVLQEMVDGDIPLNDYTATRAASFVTSFSQAEELTTFLRAQRVAGDGYFGALTNGFAKFATGSEFMQFATSRKKDSGSYFPKSGFSAAISAFRRERKLHDALRICLAYPYLSTARKTFQMNVTIRRRPWSGGFLL